MRFSGGLYGVYVVWLWLWYFSRRMWIDLLKRRKSLPHTQLWLLLIVTNTIYLLKIFHLTIRNINQTTKITKQDRNETEKRKRYCQKRESNKIQTQKIYLDAAPHAKTIRGNGITNFILHVSQCIIVNKMKFVRATLISKAWLKSLYSRFGFKVIQDFATSPTFEEARK